MAKIYLKNSLVDTTLTVDDGEVAPFLDKATRDFETRGGFWFRITHPDEGIRRALWIGPSTDIIIEADLDVPMDAEGYSVS